ncbi:MAG: sensor histidine kinase [Lachnospiraceae bacterium]|nr:sensor histidine kinase [Lachnospiraceae bacterium]MBQ7360863.1 sensor histidine kinase [Lachnospiraceae bacterium]
MGKWKEKLNLVKKEYTKKKKMGLFYTLIFILPLVVADGFLLGLLIQKEKSEQLYIAQNIVSAVKYDLTNTIQAAAEKGNSVYLSQAINDFLDYDYQSTVDYFERKMYFKDTLYDSFFSSSNYILNIYVDNPSIINGDHFQKIEVAQKEVWYPSWEDSKYSTLLMCYYDPSDFWGSAKRKISLVRKLDYFKNLKHTKFVKVDIDYSSIVRKMNNSNYEALVYVCDNGKIIFTNDGHLQYAKDFETMDTSLQISYSDTLQLYGKEFEIMVVRPNHTFLNFLTQNIWYILLVLAVNIVIPNMIVRVTYQNKLERQENDIARKNAELLALQSQINPHFLFNVLESIRMHSMLKGEAETAKMIESLALLERENVNWSSDQVSISEEMQLIEAYLQIQKYRFEDRLKYTLELAEECGSYLIPKMTLVTFVENACVHGMEGKTAGGHIYVRIYKKQSNLCLEIEDTGCGMTEEMTAEWLRKIKQYTISDLKVEEHVGIINAALRLKMLTDGHTEFEIESELGIGTFILIKVPTKYLKSARGEENELESDAGR